MRKRFIGERDCHCPAAVFNISKWLLWQILRLYYVVFCAFAMDQLASPSI